MRWMPEKKKAGAERGHSMAAPSVSTARWAKAPLSPWRLAPLCSGLCGSGAPAASTPGPRWGSRRPAGTPGRRPRHGPQWLGTAVPPSVLARRGGQRGPARSLLPDAPPLLEVQPDSLRAGWTVASAPSTAPGYWTVMVAADVEGRSARSLGRPRRPVLLGRRRWPGRPVHHHPAPKRGPCPCRCDRSRAGPARSRRRGRAAGHQLHVRQFLQALLGGQGVIARYEVAGLGVGALSPAPFTAVKLTGLSKRWPPQSKAPPRPVRPWPR